MLNELIQANEMVFMNSWTIEQYGAGIGDGQAYDKTCSGSCRGNTDLNILYDS